MIGQDYVNNLYNLMQRTTTNSRFQAYNYTSMNILAKTNGSRSLRILLSIRTIEILLYRIDRFVILLKKDSLTRLFVKKGRSPCTLRDSNFVIYDHSCYGRETVH